MPLYDYRCVDCGKETEVRRKVSEANDVLVCDCGGMMEKFVGVMPGVQYRCDGMTLEWPSDVGRSKYNTSI